MANDDNLTPADVYAAADQIRREAAERERLAEEAAFRVRNGIPNLPDEPPGGRAAPQTSSAPSMPTSKLPNSMAMLRQGNDGTVDLSRPKEIQMTDAERLGLSPKEFDALRPERRLELFNTAQLKREAGR